MVGSWLCPRPRGNSLDTPRRLTPAPVPYRASHLGDAHLTGLCTGRAKSCAKAPVRRQGPSALTLSQSAQVWVCRVTCEMVVILPIKLRGFRSDS